MPKVRGAGRREPITNEQFLRLLEAENLIGGDTKSSILAIYIILWRYGRRISEILALRKDDVDVTETGIIIKFINLKHRRGEVMRNEARLPISKSLPYVPYLMEFFTRAKKDMTGDKFFPFERSAINDHLEKASKQAGCFEYPVFPHLFRHTRVTRLREAGYSEQAICKWFGWSDSRPLNKYGAAPIKTMQEMGEID